VTNKVTSDSPAALSWVRKSVNTLAWTQEEAVREISAASRSERNYFMVGLSE
jgi:hypothetical protein